MEPENKADNVKALREIVRKLSVDNAALKEENDRFKKRNSGL